MAGVLPFDRDGEIRALSQNVQIPESGDSDLPTGVWKVSQSTASGGETYDYRGVVRGRTDTERTQLRENLMGKQNRRLSVSPDIGSIGTFTVVEATEHPQLGYFELLLRAVLPNG